MECCEIRLFAQLHDDETDADYLAPIEPVACPFCGKNLHAVNADFIGHPSQDLWQGGCE